MGLKKLLGIKPAPMLHGYRSFGSTAEVVVLGRVTESQRHPKGTSSRSLLHALRLVRSYLARPLSGITVEASFADSTGTTVTDETGMFAVHLKPTTLDLPAASEWATARISLPDHPAVAATEAPVLVEGRDNAYGVISDVDDTVLISNATQKIKLLYATIFRSPDRRLPFLGVAELYRALIAGPSGSCSNPVFYVSSSHWNLYDFLCQFFTLNKLPKGPLLLKRTAGLASVVTSAGKHEQKYEAIVTILATYPNLSFVLLGDSGQQDAEIYTRVAKEHPGRIKAIYIRDVTAHEDTHVTEAIAALGSEVPVIAGKTSLEIAEHALTNDLITSGGFDLVRNRFT